MRVPTVDAQSLIGRAAILVEQLCTEPLLIRSDPRAHARVHDGWPCPYERAAAVLRGLPDPHDSVAVWHVDITPALKRTGGIPLSLNDRTKNPHVAAAVIQRLKATTRQAVADADVPVLGHVHVELHYRPKDRRKRDEDNLVATLKPCIDSLHQEAPGWVPIVPDDDARFLSWSRPRIWPSVKGEPPSLWLVLRSSVAAGS